MAKQLNVDLRFNADVSAAKAQLQSLQTSLNQLTTGMATQGTQIGITPKLQEAQQAAVQLKAALNQSMNVETGKFDLSKFNSSLKSMNTDLSKLKTQLTNLGPQGQQTFMTLAQSIMTAEIPTKRISASLAALGTTLKNTAKWQLSSSMLHGFMSAVQTSYRYAQDLNTSLNSIRIVTGESAAAMEAFAAKANQAAKVLSASTLDYTDAALIFYQQGLKGKDVEDRTNVTIKMANVSRQSAEEVSDQLTAIWNNFYDGSQSLESFADKMVALGAATASSSDEIAGGLEKFAAVGETIGLSFDYAAAALATITSNTRQSEEVVGTALKTIFARMQSLKLGETLEDGTELNKYTEALQTVGVSIFDANNQLKDMDTILTETAGKWRTLGKDQKVALANTVAGVRQYNQFVALMDNWDDGTSDSMVANLETASNAAGSLQEQADLYAESWEAANKRVKASAEALYTSLLDDDFFIDLSNGLADLLDKIKVFVEAIGGVKGILLGLSSILLHTFSGAAAQGLDNMVYNLRSFIGLAQKDAMNMKNQVAGMVSDLGGGMQLTNQQQGSLAGAQQQVQLQKEINSLSSKWSDQQKAQAQAIMEINRLYGEQVALLGEAVDKANQQKQTSKNAMLEQSLGGIEEFTNSLSGINKDVDISSNLIEQANKLEKEFAEGKLEAKQFADAMEKLSKTARHNDMAGLASDFHRGASTNKKVLQNEETREDNSSRRQIYARRDIRDKRGFNENNPARNSGMRGIGNEELETYIHNAQEAKSASNKFAEGQKALEEATAKAKQELQNLNNASRSWSQTAVGVAQGVSSIGFGIQSLSSMFKTLTDDSASFSDKLLSAFTGLGMALPMLINGFNGLKAAIMGSNTVMTLSVALGKADVTTLNAQQFAKMTGMEIEAANQILEGLGTVIELKRAHAKGEVVKAETLKTLATKLGVDATLIQNVIEGKATLIDILRAKGLNLSLGALIKKTAATIAHTVAQVADNVAVAIAKALAGDYSGLVLLGAMAVGIATAGLLVHAAAQEQDNQKVSEASKKLDSVTKAYEKAAERAKQFKETITGYEEAVDSLENLVTGTDEYTAALEKANAEAAKMLEMYPDMQYTVENGLIKINSADMAEYYKQLKEQEQLFKMAKLQAEANVKKIENEKIQKNIDKQVKKDYGIYNAQRSNPDGTMTSISFLDEFNKKLSGLEYNEQTEFLNNRQELVDFFEQINQNNGNAYGMTEDFDKWADNIINSSEQEKQAILDNIKALNNNTAALKAEIQANQQQRYGERFVAEHGEAEIYGAEIELAKEKQDLIDYNATKEGNQSSYAAHLDDILNWKNNVSELSDDDKATIAKIFGVDESTMDDREIRIGNDLGQWWGNGDEVRLSESKNANRTSDLKLSIEEFDARAAIIQNKLTFTEAEVDAFLQNAEKRAQATEAAIESGLYSEKDILISDQNSAYDLMTVGQKEKFENRFKSEELTEETEKNIINYLDGVDASIKQKVANKLLNMSDETLNEMEDEDFKALTKEETEAFMSRDIDRVAQDQANIYNLDASTLKDVAKGFRELGEEGHKAYKNIKDDSEALVDAARVYMRMNEAIVDLKENYDDYSKTLNAIQKAQNPMDKAMAKNSESAKKLRKSLAGLLDTQEDMIDSNLLEVINPQDLEKAAKGDIAAINRIRDAFIDLQVKGIEGIDAEKFKQELNALEEGAEIKIDGEVTIGLEEFISQLVLAEMIAGASEIDIESKLSGMGISCDAVQFYDTLAEAQAAAAETGGIIVDNLSFDTTQTTGSVDMEQNQTETDVEETVKVQQEPINSMIPYQADSATPPTAVPVTGHVSYFTKTAKTNTRVVPTTTTATGMAQNVTNGAGKSGGKGKVAVVQGPRKKSGNTYNPNYSPTTTNNNGSGGGGGSSAKKPAKREKVDPQETKKVEEIERYHTLTEALEDLNRQLSEISSNRDMAWGKSKIKLINDEIKKIKELTAANERYIAAIEKDLPKDAKTIQDNYGAIIENGIITNYQELYEQAQARYNAKMKQVDAKNNAAADLKLSLDNMSDEEGNEEAKWKIEDDIDELKETAEDIKEEADEEWEKFEKEISTYEETYKKWKDALEERANLVRQEISTQLEKINVEVEVEVEISEYSLNILEYELNKLGDNVFTRAEKLQKYFQTINNKAPEYKTQSTSYQEGILEIMGSKKITGYDGIEDVEGLLTKRPELIDEVGLGFLANEFTAEEITSLKEYGESLIGVNESLYELNDIMKSSVMDTMDAWGEKIDDNIARFSTYNSILSSYRDIVTLSGRTMQDSALLKDIGEKERQNAINELSANKDNYDMYKIAEAEALDQLEIARRQGTEEDIKYWEETYETTVKKAEEAHDAMQQSWVNALQVAQDEFVNNIDLIRKEMEMAMAGQYGTLENMQQEFDMQQQVDDRYLEQYEKAYNLNKMYRDLDKQMDSTNNIRAKQKLLELQKEINKYAEEGIEMSQYDLDYLQKKYELELARIALEEAQDAKSQVRLTRDAEGNYGYVYTADQDKVADAAQNVEDKLFEMEQLSSEYIDEMSSAVISNQQEMLDALSSAHQRYLDGAYNSDEEYYADLERIQNHYLKQDEYLRTEIEKGIEGVNKTREIRGDELTRLIQGDVANNIAAYDDEKITYGKITLGKIEQANNWQTAHGRLTTAVTIGTTAMGKAFETWKSTVDTVFTEAGSSVDTFETDASQDIGEIGTKSKSLKEQIDTDTSAANTAISTSMTKVTEWQNTWNTSIGSMIAKNEAFIKSIKDVLKEQGTITDKDKDDTTPPPKDNKEEPPKKEAPTQEKAKKEETISSEAQNNSISHSDMVQLVYDMGMGKYKNNPYRKSIVEEKYPGLYSVAQGILNKAISQDSYNYHHNGTKWKNTIDSLVTAAGYNTGGYTGAWGPEGKLAILHEKELVLNKDDTTNFLTATQMLREISQMLDNNALVASLGAINLHAMTIGTPADQVLQQEVTIHADFPNVTDHNEIEIAIDNLINAASQHAYKA